MTKQKGIPRSARTREGGLFQCPWCNARSSLVLETRLNKYGAHRRRVCTKCRRRFSTQEHVVLR